MIYCHTVEHNMAGDKISGLLPGIVFLPIKGKKKEYHINRAKDEIFKHFIATV